MQTGLIQNSSCTFNVTKQKDEDMLKLTIQDVESYTMRLTYGHRCRGLQWRLALRLELRGDTHA
jgi:hypothetical protein